MFHWMWGNELRNTGFFPYGKEPIHGEPWSLVDSLQLGQLRLPKLRCCCLALVCAHVCLVAQSCPTLGDPMDCSRPGFSVHGILQGRMLEWAANPLSRGSSQPRDLTCIAYVYCIGGGFFTTSATCEAHLPVQWIQNLTPGQNLTVNRWNFNLHFQDYTPAKDPITKAS